MEEREAQELLEERDLFALVTLHGILSGDPVWFIGSGQDPDVAFADRAYNIADAMLKRREKTPHAG